LSAPIDGDWLRRWHDRHAGATSRAFADLRDHAGRSSYARLADHVLDGDRVLDLACGDGYLLEQVLARRPREATGIDFSAAELTAARARGLDAALVEGRAQALPFDDDAFDRVLCHLALMLFDDLECVLREVRRVLAPGGSFGVVVSRLEGAPASLPMRVWREELAGVAMQAVRIIDPRPLRGALPDLLLDAGFPRIQVLPFELAATLPVDRAWAWFAESYVPDRMTSTDLDRLRRRWTERMKAEGDTVRFARPMQEIIAV